MKSETLVKVGICVFVIVIIAMGINHYKKGYEKGMQELKNYKEENHVFHSEWNKTRSNADSEYLMYKSTSFDAYRKDNWFYLLRYINYVEADEGWEIYVNLERDICNLRVLNMTCFDEWQDSDIESIDNCSIEYVLGRKNERLE